MKINNYVHFENGLSSYDKNISNQNTINTTNKVTKSKNNIIIEFGAKNPLIQKNLLFGNNTTSTTKYNFFTLVPKSLFYQMCKVSNIYFLIVSILSCLSFSPKEPASMIATFAFVLIFTMIKEGIVDYKRYKQDKISNSRNIILFSEGRWVNDKSFRIRPGDLLTVKENEECPCDILIIKSSDESGYLFIDTKNLDGETNLKEKCSVAALKNNKMDERELSNVIGKISTYISDADLNNWEGILNYNNNKNIVCSINNLLLKGTVLKNTKYIYGISVYVGHHTKIMKNSRSPKQKTSTMINKMEKFLYSLFIFTIALCLIFSFLCNKFEDEYGKKYDYIFSSKSLKHGKAHRFAINFLIFFIDYYQIIPISLYVVMEIIKIYQTILIRYDFEIYDLSIDKPAESREIGLIEELGQVSFIFSDKTGTLTCNEMEFRKCFINGKVYGAEKETNNIEDGLYTINGDLSAFNILTSMSNNGKINKDKKAIELFFKSLCICHEVFPVPKNKKIIYQGAYPDDIALVKGAQQLGFEFHSKNFNTITIKNLINKQLLSYEIIYVIPFSSARKRMTVIVQSNRTSKYYVFTKGSDNVMINNNENSLITNYNYKEEKNDALKILNHFCREGLRILVMGYKEVTINQIVTWKRKIKNAGMDIKNIYDEIEKNLIFVGCSAIEDKLQDEVPSTIKYLMNCGIRIWVLTGDKQETAEQIAKQCELINSTMILYNLSQTNNFNGNTMRNDSEIILTELCTKFGIIKHISDKEFNLEEVNNTFSYNFKMIEDNKDVALIIDGITLQKILMNEDLSKKFVLLGIISKSVICCRLSPKQKSLIVNLVKSHGKFVTLAIGDGANDVPMILEASIGIGIQGKEGSQASRTADYSIGQFRFLNKLILFYGRNGFSKIAKYILYYFYKNILLVFTELMFVFYDGYSGQIFFPDWYGTMFNAIFTSWPCIFVFAYEKDLSFEICKKFPVLYLAGPKNYYFNLKIFWIYIIYAIIHSILCFIIPAYGLQSIVSKDGITMNNWEISTVSFSMIIHVVSIKLLLISNFWNWFSISLTILSVFFYYIIIIILCTCQIGKIFQPESIGIFNKIITKFPSLAMILLGPFIICLPDIIIKQISYTYFPTPVEYIMKNMKDRNYMEIMFNKNVSTNNLGHCLVERKSKKYAKGFRYIQNKIRLTRIYTRLNSSMRGSNPLKFSNNESNLQLVDLNNSINCFKKISDYKNNINDSVEDQNTDKKNLNTKTDKKSQHAISNCISDKFDIYYKGDRICNGLE